MTVMSVGRRLRRAVRALFEPEPPPRAEGPRPKQEHETKAARRNQRLSRRNQLRTELSIPTDGPGSAGVVQLDYAAHPIQLLVTSEMGREWRAHACAKEPWTVEWIEASLADGGVLYDIGANVGAFSLIASKVAGDRGAVVAFEPGYASYAQLCDNIVLNHCEAAVIPVPIALGSRSGLGRFGYKSLHAGQSRHHFTDAQWRPEDAAGAKIYEQPVLSMTLDEAMKQFGFPAPNHIKLDVDGAEVAVLRGALATLASPDLRSILIEVDDSQTDAVTALLAEQGFTLARRHKNVHEQATQVWYGVFTRPQ